MNDTAIRVEHLSKMYRLGVINNGTLWKDIQTWMALKRGKEDPHSRIGEDKYSGDEDHFWALKDLNFEIKQGDRVGIIGKNGAGKSTLLKILSRVTSPTEGVVKVRGKIASLLEVGTGFHGELTGRENIYLNGAILGMKKRRIDRRLEEIIDFSGIEHHIDTPVKRYSSGMYVRLAFAVAAHLDSDILIADEVLAVGDAEFQKKALGKMQDLSTGQGRTVLFVSHNLSAVASLCNRGIVMDKGKIFYRGDAPEAIYNYTELNNTFEKSEKEISKFSSDSIRFISGRILNLEGKSITSVSIQESFHIEMKYFVGPDIQGIPVPNFHFKTSDGVYAFIVNAPGMKEVKSGVYKAVCKVPGNVFNDGIYSIGLAVTEYTRNSLNVHFFEENYLTITVIDPVFSNPYRYGYGGRIPGVLRPHLDWTLEKEDL